jgi:predicted metal-dependent phosphoesterase TrpH
MIIDMHVHTSLSPCSTLALTDILAHARSRGLDGVCVTDHDCMQAGRVIREGVQADGLVVIVGMEYTTPEGDFLVFGNVEDLRPGLSAGKLLSAVSGRLGAVVAAHPFRRGRSTAAHLISSGCVDIIESVNGRNTAEENSRARDLLVHLPMSSCGGSDAHTLEELGCVRTRFDMPISSRADLVQALRKGLCRPEADGCECLRLQAGSN